MSTTVDRPVARPRAGVSPARWVGPGLAPAAVLPALMAVTAVVLTSREAVGADDVIRALLVATWALAAGVLMSRPHLRRLGRLALLAALVGAVGALSEGVLVADLFGHARGAAHFGRAMAVSLLPAVGLHLLVSLPDGHTGARARRMGVAVGYAIGVAIGLGVWSARPDLPAWPVIVAAGMAAVAGLPASHRRYMAATGTQRQRLQWLGCAVALVTWVAVIAGALRFLVGWPRDGLLVVCATSVLVPVALAAGASTHLAGRADRFLVATVSVTGLSGVVAATYLAIVVGLGRVPDEEERTLLLLSMVAAAVAAALYIPARERLARMANSLVYGERRAPEEVLNTFGNRLSRAVPLDELLLQLAESLRKTMALQSAEVWTGTGGALERTVSVPERGPARLTLGPKEVPVVARAGVSGPAWVAVWLPGLLAGREGAPLRVAPVTNSGELFGLIVAQRRAGDEAFAEEEERVLTELARQVGLALRNVELDSALQASLDEVRHHAEELRASRSRIVAASDAARRRIERDLHDGAQQRLVALAVNLRLVRDMAEDDPAGAKAMLAEISNDLRDTIQELRDLAHGIYPPLLVDSGLGEALRAAAGRSPVETAVVTNGVRRYDADVEAAVYFCCLEALQNAGKHAGPDATVTIRIWEEAGALLFEVADDGPGFDAAVKGRGQGFVNMADRLGAIGGRLRVESQPGNGTTISGTIPMSSG